MGQRRGARILGLISTTWKYSSPMITSHCKYSTLRNLSISVSSTRYCILCAEQYPYMAADRAPLLLSPISYSCHSNLNSFTVAIN